MSIRISFKYAAILVAALLSVAGAWIVPAGAAEPARPVVSAEARDLVERMGKSLLAQQFSFTARTLRVYRDANNQPLHIGHVIKVVVRRPDRLRIDVNGDDGETQLFYDGKTTFLYGPQTKKYASASAPDNIEAMLHAMAKRLRVDFPLADFVDNAPAKSVLFGITSGREVNTATIDGTPCAHLVFDQPGIEFEMWIEKTERAVPRRLVATYHSVPDQPIFYAEFSDWNFDIHPADAEFVFQPPPGAVAVAIKPENAAPAQQKATKP
jgi:hypothetical protein